MTRKSFRELFKLLANGMGCWTHYDGNGWTAQTYQLEIAG
jgi:hypothetical protein